MKCLALALAYKARGWSVIPVGKNKRPVIPSWKKYQSEMPTDEEITQWFTDNPDAQVGIVTGYLSDLTVVDVEVDGDFSLIKDVTYTVKTGGGGRHFYFQYDSDFQNMVRVLPEVDIRSEGGYVVAAGSETEKGAYEVVANEAVMDMSHETKRLLLGVTPPASPQKTGGDDVFTRASVMRQRYDVDAYPGYGEGERNDQMTRFIGALLSDHERIHPAHWDTTGWEFVKSANQKNTPPLNERELKAIFESVKKREIEANPQGRQSRTTEWGPVEVESGNAERAVILHASEAAKRQEIDTANAYSTGFPVFDESLLGGFSPGEVVVVAGKTGHGKTSIMQKMTIELAKPGDPAKNPLPALWFSYEVLPQPLWDKFIQMGASEETPIFLPSFNESGNVEWVSELLEKGIEKLGIKVLAIDHLGFLRPPKGTYANQADAITHTVRHLKRLAVKYGVIVLLPVHMRKTAKKEMDTDDIKDSTGIAQEADTVFFIERVRDRSTGLFKDESKLGLIKNRKTGASTSVTVPFAEGTFFYDPSLDKVRKEEEAEERKQEDHAEEAWNAADDF